MSLYAMATSFAEVVVAAWLLDQTGEPGWIAAGEACRLVPMLAIGPLAGVAADRYDRRRLLTTVAGVQGLTMAALAVVVHVSASPGLAVALVLVAAAIGSPFQLAVAASTPFLVGETSLAAANAAGRSVAEISLTVGPALGALVFVLTSASWALVVDAALFAGAGALALLIGPGRRSASATGRWSDYAAQFREGLQVVRRSVPLVVVTSFMAAVLFVYGFERVLHVVVADRRLGIGADGVGLLSAGLGVGSLLIAPFSARIAEHRRPGAILALSGVLMGLPLAALALISQPVVAVVVLVFEGAANLVFEVVLLTLVQRLAPGPALGRVLGLQDGARAAAQLTGVLFAPVALGLFGLQATLLVSGGGLALYALVASPALERAAAAAEVRRRVVAPIVAELTPLALFDGATVAALERIGGATTPEAVPAGRAVVREYEPADDLFVVRSGGFTVTVGGRVVNRLAGGDWFGEIGLVRRIPRTATVRADTPAELWRIPGDAFLEAVETLGSVPDTLNLGIAARLERGGALPGRAAEQDEA
jgi:predicted MFS family arabinose efflux permease